MTDLKVQYESIKEEIDVAVQDVISGSDFILGQQVNSLESEIGRYFGIQHAIGVASGTDALVIALSASGIESGDEVITTPFTFIATAEAINRLGAKPVFCDIDGDTFNIDVAKIKNKITPRTKAIIPVHLYGYPCDMEIIVLLAKEHGLKIVEDCAQSFGSEYESKKTGTIGDCGCLSFFPAKTLGCYGDGGMIVTGNSGIAAKASIIGNHGSHSRYFYSLNGFNSRLDTLQAAVLRVKLKYIDRWINKRITNAMLYNKLLSGIPDIVTPSVNSRIKHSFNYYTIRVKGKRDKVQKCLKEKNIASAVYYPLSLHLQEVYKNLGYKAGDFPIAERAQSEVLSLPMYPELTEEIMLTVVAAIKEVV